MTARHFYRGRDGTELAWHSSGPVDGRPVLLVHGLLGSGARLADTSPVRALAGRGCRVILPDLRGHGDSGRPHDPACYPPDVVADDVLALVDELGLDDYDLGGYSAGGKVVLRLLARGARPARAVVAGQGVDALDATSSRTAGYRRLLAAAGPGEPLTPGSPEEAMSRGAAQSGVDPLAVSHLLGSMVATPRAALGSVRLPVLIMVGADDSRGASAGELAQLLPDARLVRVPGDHETAFDTDSFTAALLEFLAGR